MNVLFEKENKQIKIEEILNKIFISDGKHSYQMDSSQLGRLIEKLVNRGYRSRINL